LIEVKTGAGRPRIVHRPAQAAGSS
jgi:hypothetical protein